MTTPAQYEAAIRKLEEVLSFVGGFNPPMLLHEEDRPALEAALAIVREAREDAARLDCLEHAANEPDGLHLHNGYHRGCNGLGLARLGRTLREAVDQSLRPEVPDAR